MLTFAALGPSTRFNAARIACVGIVSAWVLSARLSRYSPRHTQLRTSFPLTFTCIAAINPIVARDPGLPSWMRTILIFLPGGGVELTVSSWAAGCAIGD